MERVHELGQSITVLLELSERKAQKLLPAACVGMTVYHTCEHQSANHKHQLQDEPGQAGGVHCAASIGSWGKVLTRFQDGAGLELTFKAKLVPEWSGVGRMEQSHELAILGAHGALDTKEMKALDDLATAGSNTEDFLELCRLTEVCAKRAPLLTLANLARRVPALLGEDVPAVSLQGSVCKFMQVLSCFACGKTFSRARRRWQPEVACVQSRPQAAETDAQIAAE